MSLRDSYSRLKKKLKHPLTTTRRNPGTAGTDSGEGLDLTSSLPQSGSHIVAGSGHDEEADGRRVYSTDRPPQSDQPGPVPARGSENDQGGGEVEVDGRGVGQKGSHSHSDVEVAVEGGPGREGIDANGETVERVHPPPSTPSIPHSGGPDNSIGTSTIPNHIPETSRPDESIEPSAAADESKLDWKTSTVGLLRGVRNSAGAFGPLKSVAGSLYSILENCERTEVNEQAIGLLAPRVKMLSESLGAPIPLGDVNEKERERKLERKLEDILWGLTLPAEQEKVAEFLANAENVQRINGLVEDIHESLMDYQTSLQQEIYNANCQLIESVDLVLLKGMHHTADASYLCGNREGCLRGTRTGVLWEIEHWLTSAQDQQVFWLNGLAGTGKSTIAQTFAETSFADGKLGASFFCSRDFEDRSNLQAIFPTLAFQLAFQYLPFRKELLQVLKACPDVAQESLCSQMEKLIVGPLKATHISTLIIIDALDECKDKEPASAILSILSRYVNKIPNVKFFITGRPEPRIRTGFRLKSLLKITEVFKLHEVQPKAVDSDIELFFRTQLTDLAEGRSDCNSTGDWPSSSDIGILCKKAAGFFIYASTVIKFVASENHKPTKRLNQIILLSQDTSHEGRSGIDILYSQVLEQMVNGAHTDDEDLYSSFRTVVGAVLLVFNPLSVKALSELLGVSDISTTLRSFHSLLLIPTNEDSPVRAFHKSFPDFLMDPKRCTDYKFFIDPSIYHREILFSCFNVMKEGLKKNICRLDDYVLLSEIEDLPMRRKAYIGDTLMYACRFWTNHLANIPGSGPDVGEVHKAIDTFFTTHLLCWIEVLILMRNLDLSICALNDVQQWYTLAGVPCKWANDSQHLLLKYFGVICDSPSQLYHSALPLCPSLTWFHEHYSMECSQEVKVIKGLQAEWGMCFCTVAFDYYLQSLVCWKDTAAVGFHSDIIILDGTTGSQVAVLSEHTHGVTSLAFSSDGTSLASGSYDTTVKLWDVQTGGVVKTFHGHTHWVACISISVDCTTIASGSDDRTIRLWDIQTGKCHYIIKQESLVNYISYSPIDPHYLISVSDHQVWWWDANGNQTKPPYDGSHIAFSLDGTQLAICQGWNVIIQSIDSRAIIAKLHVAKSNVRYCCLSPNGRLVAVAAGSVVYVWDITGSDPHLIRTFIGHTYDVTSLAFSSPSSLVSASVDKSVKFWNIGTSSVDRAITDSKSKHLPLAPIKSITLQATDGITISSDSNGVVRTWDLSTGLCKASFQTPAKNPMWGDVRLVNSRLIFIWLSNEKIHVWDVEKGESLKMIHTKGYVEDVKISEDGSRVFCLYWTSIQAWSIWTGEAISEVEVKNSLSKRFLTVGGSRVWLHFPKEKPQGWDFGISGQSPVQLSTTPLYLNNTKLWDFSLSGIKDIVTGKVFFQMCGKFVKPVNAQWDGQYLVTGYESGEVLILNFNHML